MTHEFELAAIYQRKSGERRCLVIGGRADMLAGRPGATSHVIGEADPSFDTEQPFLCLLLDEGVNFRDMDPYMSDGPMGHIPRAYVEYPGDMKPVPLEGDSKWDGWPWVADQ